MSVWRQTGVKPDQLEPVPLPELFLQTWEDFLELHSARGSTGFGAAALSYSEIDSWNKITGAQVSAQDVRLIKRLDHIFMAHSAKQQQIKEK